MVIFAGHGPNSTALSLISAVSWSAVRLGLRTLRVPRSSAKQRDRRLAISQSSFLSCLPCVLRTSPMATNVSTARIVSPSIIALLQIPPLSMIVRPRRRPLALKRCPSVSKFGQGSAQPTGKTGRKIVLLPSPFIFSVPQFASGDEEWHIHSLRREWSGFVGMVVGHFPFAFGPTRSRFIGMSSVLARDLMAGTDLFNFAAMR
jgi:hypothetical protein